MTSENSPPSPSTRRRSSFASSILGRSLNEGTPGPIATAAAEASERRRRTSLASLSGSPPSASSFPHRNQNTSIGSTTSNNQPVEESAIEDIEGDGPPVQPPRSPIARRMSWTAKALTSSSNGNNKVQDGLHWSEQIMNKAQRSTSMTLRQQPPMTIPEKQQPKSQSVAIPEQPAKENARTPKKPDHLQERILKGDFYMD